MMRCAAAIAAGALVAACSGGPASEETASPARTGPTGDTMQEDGVVSVAEARESRSRGRLTVEGALFISLVPREKTQLCAAVVYSGALPRCERPAVPARVPQGPLEGLEATPNGWVVFSPRPMRFVGSFRGKVFRIERILG